MSLTAKALLIILSSLVLAGFLWVSVVFLPFSSFLILTYSIFGVLLISAAFIGPQVAGKPRSLSLWEALLLFLIIMAIRLFSYAESGLLLEKIPMVLVVLFWAFSVKGWGASQIGLTLKKLPLQLFLGLGFAALYWILYQATFALYTATSSGLSGVFLFSYPQELPRSISLDPVTFLLVIFFYSNFAEELLFRGLLLKEALQGGRRFLLFFLFQALLFGLYHVNYALFPVEGGGIDWPFLGFYVAWTFLFGIGFAFAYLISRSVLSNTILHVLANVMQSNWLFLFLPSSSGKAAGSLVDAALVFRESIVRPALVINALIFATVLGGIWFFFKRKSGVRAAPGMNLSSGQGSEDSSQ